MSLAGPKKDVPQRVSKVSTVEPPPRAKSRVMSSIGLSYAARQSVAWRSSGKGFKVPKFQNSYRLEPYMPFKCSVSDKILALSMNEALQDVQYHPETSSTLCRDVAANVRERLYKTDFDRVKYVVTITIVENTGQSIVSMTGRLWDSERDTYSVYVFESPTLYAAGTVNALYYE